MESVKPSILDDHPTPRLTQRSFHGRKLQVWEGVTSVSNVMGWVNNPRLELELKRFRDDHAGKDPSDTEVLAIMKAVSEFGLKELADDIRSNGVRQPIILSSNNKLLDGNRRIYAVKFILENIDANDPNIQDYKRIPVWILDESCSLQDEHRILVQENFYPGLKVEWPDFVKARFVYDDLTNGIPAQSVSQKYGWRTSKVNETRKIMDLIGEFIEFATSPKSEEGLGLPELESERIAAESYQYFNEAQKSFLTPLSTNIDFKIQFFRWIAEKVFSSFQEVRIAWDGWNDPNVRHILLSSDPEAGKKARAEIEYKKVISRNTGMAADRISEFVKFLEQLTAAEISTLSEESISLLGVAITTVSEMAKAVKGS